MELKSHDASSRRKNGKKRPARDQDISHTVNDIDSRAIDEADGDFDTNEPTMGEKLENLRLLEDADRNILNEKEPSVDVKPPSANSVHGMLKQSLNAEDYQLLLNCLYTRDDKVIANSVAQLSPSDVLKLLNSLVSITQTRGSVLACALPWLRSLLIQHASSIMAQESSLTTLNSLYQLIESRTSTFGAALQLSTCLDFLFKGVADDEVDDESIPPPIIIEDMDSDEESDNNDVELDEDSEGKLTSECELAYDSEGSDVMSQ